MTPIRRLAFVVNAQKSGAHELSADLIARAEAVGVATRVTRDFPLPEGLLQDVDACCVIGGDGTLLGAAPAAAAAGIPLIGVNRNKQALYFIFFCLTPNIPITANCGDRP